MRLIKNMYQSDDVTSYFTVLHSLGKNDPCLSANHLESLEQGYLLCWQCDFHEPWSSEYINGSNLIIFIHTSLNHHIQLPSFFIAAGLTSHPTVALRHGVRQSVSQELEEVKNLFKPSHTFVNNTEALVRFGQNQLFLDLMTCLVRDPLGNHHS